MYVWVFRYLPGPRQLKVFESAVLITLIAWVLFTYVYPWVRLFFGLGGADL